MPILRAIKTILLRLERFLIYRVFSLSDTPHRIALGVAIGMFVTWLPAIGMQMILVVALATLLKANKFVGVPFVWISNPATIVPIYYPNYWIGAKILGHSAKDGWESIKGAISFQGGLVDRMSEWNKAMMPIFWEMLIGSVIVGLVLGVITYFVMLRMIVVYRRKLHAWQAKHGRAPRFGESIDEPPADADEPNETDAAP